MISVSARRHSDFDLPLVVTTDKHTRGSTVFHLATKDNSFAVFGTHDEIVAFGAAIIASQYDWLLDTGHTEWLGESEENAQDGSITSGYQTGC